ncbi:response regulator [Paenibacillus thalictri]|uniref:Response regulator n=1 Tax=Paenibacillus thalictri TaxID=2527873 RepID=A0A4Q9DWS6_9BACL|nr:response regulator [Paenibacillus thalictri]TBL81547.1 response regulator [Paenibacillus thalictri]
MRIVLVDDERLALIKLEKQLLELDDCEVIGRFMNAEEAVSQIAIQRPDVVFIDIHMPEMNGLQATERIRMCSPLTEIVFVTAHNEYALKAFGLEALDYVMKPVSRERLNKTIDRLQRRLGSTPKPKPPAHMLIRCMGMLHIQKHNGERERLKWRTAKIKELFAYLFHYRQRMVSKESLLELLWPDLDEQKGSANLHTSIHRIRSMFKEANLEGIITINYSSYGYIMETHQVRIDTVEWEEQLRQLPRVSFEHVSEHQKVLDLYEGAYYEEENYVWAEVERQRLKALWMQHARQLGRFYYEHGMDSEALAVYHRIQKLDPLEEDNALALMNIYARMKDTESVETQYQYLVNILQQEAGVSPGPEIANWYMQWKRSEKKTLAQ